ncbi:MAG: hypothetical protein JOZ97_02150, partial [Candidatus Eremiobacteraeota bacterium]|nr:hypothetical protein [Candidatus Eremiobacteraeota bacterium]
EGSKASVVQALLQHPSDEPAAAPFYRALRQIGPRAADEALIALRIVLAGKQPSDEKVRAIRHLVQRSRAGGDDALPAQDAYFAELR